MILVIDNYDSFVYNLARYFECAGQETHIIRNDEMNCAQIKALAPLAIVLSPGPCSPDEAGICLEVVRELGGEIPILGVCLGHQAIAQAYGWKTVRAPHPVHGKSSAIVHEGTRLFKGVSSPLSVARYHSLMAQPDRNNDDLIELAHFNQDAQNDSIIMALHHKIHPVYGVQFHPESILTENGDVIIANFIQLAKQWHQSRSKKGYAA